MIHTVVIENPLHV